MKYQIDEKFLLDCFKEIVETPSPVGYYVKMNPVMERYAAMFGQTVTYDNKSNAYITLDGEDNSKTVLIGAHLDTLGLIVRRVDANGMIRVRQLGGVNYASYEGETVTIHTRDGREYTGLMACQSHSVHVFDDARTVERNENTMMIILDEKVKSKEDVYALGIRNGDFVSIDPRCQITKNGFLKSRFIDDKAAVACTFAMLKYLTENNLKPKYRTILAFPYTEEIGLGGAYVPAEVSEYVAIDIGLIGPDYEGNEYNVAICAKDAAAPYDFELTTRLVNYAEKAGCDYCVDIFYRYGTDGTAALKGGNNVRVAAFGMPVYCSHGMERTHVDSLTNTTNLMLAYTLDI
ncbi:MAG: M42 family metallopeptidase [Oscillospiraceae bacterium]|nr:M42 family metallopeptidase [Oscillospiraceae bacterium]